MIIPSQGLRIVLAVRPVDFRCGHDALAALVQNRLGLDPHSGLIVVFRSKRMDRLKILLWDGSGLVLIYKRLGEGGFSWPADQRRRPATDEGSVRSAVRRAELEARRRADRGDADCCELIATSASFGAAHAIDLLT